MSTSTPEPTTNEVARAFDLLAPHWDAAHGPRSGRRLGFALRAALFRDLARGLPQRRILDVGCGTGQYLLALGGLVEEAVGLDISRAMIERARRNAQGTAQAERLRFIAGSVEEFRAGAPAPFDLVAFFGSLEHMADPRAAVTAAAHCLAPGGLLLVLMVHPSHPRGLKVRLAERNGTMPPVRLMSPRLVRGWAEDLGLAPMGLFSRARQRAIGGAPRAALAWLAAASLLPLLLGLRVQVFSRVRPLRLVLPEAGQELGEVAGPVANVELEAQDLVPAVPNRAG